MSFENNQLKRWCEEAGGNIQVNYITHGVKETMTVLDKTNPFWVAFKGAVDDMYVEKFVSFLLLLYFALRKLIYTIEIFSGGS